MCFFSGESVWYSVPCLRNSLRGSHGDNDSAAHEPAPDAPRMCLPVPVKDLHVFRRDPGPIGTRAWSALRVCWNRKLRRHSRRPVHMLEGLVWRLRGWHTSVHILVHASLPAFKVS